MSDPEDQLSSELFARLRFRDDPLADPASIVVRGPARFTVLTPRLLRLEWSARGQFEDRSTYAFPTRRAPAPPFAVRSEGDALVLDTGMLTLYYRPDGGPFSAANLVITFDLDGEPQRWAPGTPNPANLRGTRRTLDACEAAASLGEGLLSRAGWALFDDSPNVVFADGWVASRPDHELQDWYFFGYGHDYKAALADYTRFGGSVPLVPRFALGAWWSRYWAYSASELQELVGDFERYGLPLDVLVVDMDWHTPHAWTGYTWNRDLFPDPPGFLQWAHDKGLCVTLNLHPAQGVQPFEEVYPRFAVAMGVDPAGGEAIPFRIADRRFVQAYFELLHHPMEDEGVDFWWMDWQQGTASGMKGLDPLPWINHLHFADSTRRGRRPLLYSRWGGLGNQRYPIGFSGDTVVGWPALQFQPYFTATAANVACGWWSHDIGGHMGAAATPEMFARWVQFGALSPTLRLHATKDARAERRPWKYPDEAFQAAKEAFLLRYQLIPYLYTMARRHSDTGLPLCRPMYYEHPGEEAAYAARSQYFLGDALLAAPIVQPADPATGLAADDVWVPSGTWIDYQTKETWTGPRWVRLVGGLRRVPLLVRAGTILPLAAPFQERPAPALASGTSTAIPVDRLVLAAFPGPAGRFRLYEDDGVSEHYRQGDCEWTEITTAAEDSTWVVEIAPVQGRCAALPERRQYEVRLVGSHEPRHVVVSAVEIADWTYDLATLTTTVLVPPRDKRAAVRITAVAVGPIVALGPAHNAEAVSADVRRLLGTAGPPEADLERLLAAALPPDVPGRNNAVARLGGPFAHIDEFVTSEDAAQRLGQVVVAAPAGLGERCDVAATFTLLRSGRPEQRTVHLAGVTAPHVIAVPFAFDGTVQALRWEAEVRLTWRGQQLGYAHRSRPLFPAVYAWRVLFYDPEEGPIAPQRVLTDPAAAGRWAVYRQSAEGLRNLNQPYLVLLWQELQARAAAGRRGPLACYLASTVTSPDERPAVLLCRTQDPVDIYLNGKAVEVGPEEEDLSFYPFQVRRTAAARLCTGPNELVVHSAADPDGPARWYFGAAFTTAAGEWMGDLAFD